MDAFLYDVFLPTIVDDADIKFSPKDIIEGFNSDGVLVVVFDGLSIMIKGDN